MRYVRKIYNIMTISEEELQRIVATAVKVALNEIKGKET